MDNFSLQLRVRYTNINCLSKMFAYIIFHYVIYQYMERNTYTYYCFLVYIYVTYQYIYLLSNSYIYYFFLVFIYVIPTYSVISQQVIHKSSFITQFVSTYMYYCFLVYIQVIYQYIYVQSIHLTQYYFQQGIHNSNTPIIIYKHIFFLAFFSLGTWLILLLLLLLLNISFPTFNLYQFFQRFFFWVYVCNVTVNIFAFVLFQQYSVTGIGLISVCALCCVI
eukprot:TRINITY_DN3636_c1_g1_i2.p3 TRINITY_DN3636_c1_g1~~TRINITY_DN3636_c1_g1_i2.p3  ORF type:complete len:221 (-),score=-40.38 TRINITY_DN3636_c1_g1_i2:95-757(-)